MDAYQKQRRQQERTARIAQQQQERAGYSSTPGYDPSDEPRQRYVAEADRAYKNSARRMGTPMDSKPLGVSQGVISSAEQERRRREKAASGKTLTNADL